MKNPSKTPIALFTYNRPDHTRRLLESLGRCASLDQCQLHIYCDGPKSIAQTDSVEMLRRVVRQYSPALQATVVERTENLGVARSVVTGVTDLCREYGRVIVIEDDLQLDSNFIDYMLQALVKYRDEEAVYQISGYMFPMEHPRQPDCFFLPLTTTWGWATWQRAWRIFDWNAPAGLEQLADPAVRRRFDLDGVYPFAAMLERQLAGENDSWGILWWWTVFNVGGLVLHPRLSLVQNSGFDGSGIHCKDSPGSEGRAALSEQGFSTHLSLPDEIVVDEIAFERVKRFLAPYQETGRPFFRGRFVSGLRKFLFAR